MNTESVKMPSPMLMMMNVIMIMKVEVNNLAKEDVGDYYDQEVLKEEKY